jgi:hypothetical protein
MAEPTTMPLAMDLIDFHAARVGSTVARQPIKDMIEAIIDRHSVLGDGSEVAWALWAALHWKINLSGDASGLTSRMSDDVVAVLALHAQAEGLFATQLELNHWNSLVQQAAALTDEHWLLTYEGCAQGWLMGGAPAIQGDPFFVALKNAGADALRSIDDWQPHEPTPGSPYNHEKISRLNDMIAAIDEQLSALS